MLALRISAGAVDLLRWLERLSHSANSFVPSANCDLDSCFCTGWFVQHMPPYYPVYSFQTRYRCSVNLQLVALNNPRAHIAWGGNYPLRRIKHDRQRDWLCCQRLPLEPWRQNVLVACQSALLLDGVVRGGWLRRTHNPCAVPPHTT